ncbi:NUDIX hydrolase [Legionella waltersii]|uniref:Mutator MutT protein n=1 Tax=Legionella waltersii TaxID=66969 RepID=A0A0W1A0V3_9GAMM|nr:NUDIX hydrolase [Legionella waltersii]KTD74973.1 Mutator MutT protein [Legionella waltersii]SNV08383.1 Mutator MutT protein [Legionella waltersii]
MNDKLLKWVSEIHALSQNGLTFSKNEFDIERYHRLDEIAKEMAAHFSDKNFDAVAQCFSMDNGYTTPKLDVRGFVLKNDKLLLVRERSDNLWTLPGGWVDVNESPSEAVVRELFEETGFNVEVNRLLALWDKQKHDHPPRWPHTYKIFFQCDIVSGEKKENLEISEIDFFPMNQLPDLSIHRVTANQLLRLYDLALHSEITSFD